jgi:hypothetical protein
VVGVAVGSGGRERGEKVCDRRLYDDVNNNNIKN